MKILIIVVFIYLQNIYGQVWPINNSSTRDVITSCYGPRDKNPDGYTYDFHYGYDIRADSYTNVYASISGIVSVGYRPDDFGYFIIIWNSNNLHGVIYAHLSDYVVSDGASVAEGQLVGYSGNSGQSQAPHLHFTYYVNVDDIVFNNMYHPLHLFEYTNYYQTSPTITNATCDNISNVNLLNITVKTSSEDLDYLFFKIKMWQYEYYIDFDLSNQYRTNSEQVTISMDENNQDNTKVIITTNPLDYNTSDTYQVINYTFDYSLWNFGYIFASDICFSVGDVIDVNNDYEEQDENCSFSAELFPRSLISIMEKSND